MFQYQYQVHKPITTAHLAQTMTLLSLSAFELKQQIDSELASNPALEIIEERRCPHCKRILPENGACPICSRPMNSDVDEPIVYVSPMDDFIPRSDYNDSDYSEEPFSPVTDDLTSYVIKQIAPELSKDQQLIAVHLLTNTG